VKAKSYIDHFELFQSMPGRHLVIGIDDPDFTLLDENAAHEEVAMVKRSDIIGRPFFDVFPDTSEYYKEHGVSEITLSFRRVIETGKPDSMAALKYDIRDSTGAMAERWWQATHYPLFDKDGKLYAIFQQTEDITEKLKADTSLSETKYQLEEALAIGQIGTWNWDVTHDIVIADANLARMFGIPDEEAAQGLSLETFTDSIYVDDQPSVLHAIQKAMAKRTTYEKEYRTVSRDGTIRSVIARGKVRENASGEVSSFSGIIFDITDRKAAENNLAFLAKASTVLASSLDYGRSLHSIAQMIVPTVADWCIVSIEDESSKQMKTIALKGVDNNKMSWLKQALKDHAHDLREVSPYIDSVMKSSESVYHPHVTAGKTAFEKSFIEELAVTSLISVPLIVRDSAIGVMTVLSTEQRHVFSKAELSMFEDLGRRISLAMTNAHYLLETRQQLIQLEKLREELTHANEELETRVQERTAKLKETNINLERSNQELQDFAYVASHDLQEPLRKIQAFGTILEEEYAETLGDGNDYLSRMRSAAARMSTLIEDLLAFSRVTTHAKIPKEIDLQKTVSEVVEDLEARIRDNDGEVVVGKLPVLSADPTQMRQLFQNIIGNALKFHRPDVPPRVSVSAKLKKSTLHREGEYEITIADNGVGFDEKYLDRIFAVFQRLHSRESYEGTGIGLAVCRKIVERHGGTITARSTLGEGSTFIITLPVPKKAKEK
jgi:PAS domain S-box-containing protein